MPNPRYQRSLTLSKQEDTDLETVLAYRKIGFTKWIKEKIKADLELCPKPSPELIEKVKSQ